MKKIAVVIDDDEDDLQLMCEAITVVDNSIECVKFQNANRGVKELFKATTLAPDYIFIDYNMPMMPGDVCLRLLRKERKFDKSTIVIISTFMPSKSAMQFIASGANYAIQKPRLMEDYYDFLKSIIRIRNEGTLMKS